MSSVSLTFLGATETVTGSRTLISTQTSNVLIDAGLYQGSSSIEDRNWEKLSIDPASIDAIILTHAHLDHCGYLPRLVRMGFRGKIYSTHYTKALASVVLYDSAYLQMEDTKFAKKKGYSKHKDPEPLYNTNDVEETINKFQEVAFKTKVEVAPDIFVTFHPSGHILGSAFVAVDAEDRSLLFSGDMGRPNHPILVEPDAPPLQKYDVVVSESTYGDRIHETTKSEFADELRAALARGGSILIPAFAVDRTEIILMALHDLIEKREIPSIPIYIDSPMALASLKLYREAIFNDAPEIRSEIKERYAISDPFNPGALHEMSSVEQSKSLNDLTDSSIIISASGMATGGRVVHHLANMLPNSKNTVILVGYQAAGSRGRLLEQGAKSLRIHGEDIQVKAHISRIETFSAHADSQELIGWLRGIKEVAHTYVIHGEPESSTAFTQLIQHDLHWKAEVPQLGKRIGI